MTDAYTELDYHSSGPWTRLWQLKPDRSPAFIVDRFLDFEMERLLYESGTLRYKVPATYPAINEILYEGESSADCGFRNWGIRFYYRDTGSGTNKVFSGIAPPVTGWRHQGRVGSGWMVPLFISDFQALMMRRQVFTEDGTDWTCDDTPDEIARELVRTNCCSGTVVTPDNCDWDRTAFGPSTDPWKVACEATPTGANQRHPDTMEYRIQHGTNLYTALIELFSGIVPDTDNPCDLWPTFVESAPGEWDFGVLYGRSGANRNVGSDTGFAIAPERGNLLAWQSDVDGLEKFNVMEVRGEGRRTRQRRVYVGLASATGEDGPIETSWTCPDSTTDEELEYEGKLYLHAHQGGVHSYELEIRERDGLEYPDDFKEGDTIIGYSGQDPGLFGLTAQLDIIGVRLSIPVPGLPNLRLLLGEIARNPLQMIGRHVGGLGGGLRGGSRPARKSGATPEGCQVNYRVWMDESLVQIAPTDCDGYVKLFGDQWIDTIATNVADESLSTPDLMQWKWCLPEIEQPPQWNPETPDAWGKVCLRSDPWQCYGVPLWGPVIC